MKNIGSKNKETVSKMEEAEKSYEKNKTDEKEIKYLLTSTIIIFVLAIILIIIALTEPESAEIEVKSKMVELRLKLNYNKPEFITQRMKEDEKQLYRNGEFYKIDLINGKTHKKLLFKTGKYFLEEENSEINNSIDSFFQIVYKYINMKYETAIFIKGTADLAGNTSFSGTLVKPYDSSNGFEKFKINPYVNDILYDTTSIFCTIPKKFTNVHLPNLRARYLQRIVESRVIDLKENNILEGKVSDLISEQERNAYLILYINKAKIKPDFLKKINEITFQQKALLLIGISILLFAIIVYIFFLIKYYKK